MFNGMGTKGLSLAPYLGKYLAEALIRNSDSYLPDEVRLDRFKTFPL